MRTPHINEDCKDMKKFYAIREKKWMKDIVDCSRFFPFCKVFSTPGPQVSNATLYSVVPPCCAPSAGRKSSEDGNRRQRCGFLDVPLQWRLSPLTLHTQTLFRRPFVPTTHCPTTLLSPSLLANPISFAKNKSLSPPPTPNLQHPLPPPASGRT